MLAGWYEKGGPAEKVIEVGDMEIPHAGSVIDMRTYGIGVF